MILLDKKQKKTMVVLLFMMLIGAILETTSITMIFPVVQAIMMPDSIEGGVTGKIYHFLHMQSLNQFIVVVMLGLIIAFIAKNLFLFFQMKALYRFI